jgi:Ni,Fe-hydrogenase maturation factor
MKQTAVQFLIEQIKTSKYFYKVIEDIQSRSTVAQSNIFEQAKEMEKEQIIDAVNFGDERGKIQTYSTAEQYYEETYKREQTKKANPVSKG